MKTRRSMVIDVGDKDTGAAFRARDACRLILFDEQYFKTLTAKAQRQFRTWRSRYNDETLQDHKMEKIVLAHGYIVAQERLFKRIQKK